MHSGVITDTNELCKKISLKHIIYHEKSKSVNLCQIYIYVY